MSDLWAEAGMDHEAAARETSLARAGAELESVMPFLLASRSAAEFTHRRALAADALAAIAARCGLGEDELAATAARHYELYRQALAEGMDPLDEVSSLSQGGSGFGAGPEKPYEHDEEPDFSGDYAEVPLGAPRGPGPQVTQVRPPRVGPVSEPVAMRRQASDAPQAMMTPSYQAPAPPAAQTGVTPGATAMPPAPVAGIQPGQLPAGVNPLPAPGTGQVTSSSDPVRRKVMAVTAVIRESNPQLPPAECERVARVVVGRYLTADLTSQVMYDDPGTSGGTSDGGASDGGGMSGLEQYGLGRALMSKIPGGGASAGESGLVGPAAELAAL